MILYFLSLTIRLCFLKLVPNFGKMSFLSSRFFFFLFFGFVIDNFFISNDQVAQQRSLIHARAQRIVDSVDDSLFSIAYD